ncbi:MAG: GPW/gp25 family protein [Acidobacteria bacterium]|nr:GPW/gp25 family protein [Acidobacteriota bacterium]
MISDEDDIRSSLRILLSTAVGERRMQPRYGCNVDRLVFEPADGTLQAYLKDLVTIAILYFEPRIILDDLTLEAQPFEGRILLTLSYTITQTNTRYNFVYPFYLTDGTEIRP